MRAPISLSEDSSHIPPSPTASVLSCVPIEEKDWWVTNTEQLNEEEDSTLDAPDDELQKLSADENNTTQDSGETQFHNRGYEVWEQCREAWRNGSSTTEQAESTTTPRKSPTRPLSGMQRRSVLMGLSRHREYNLPRRIRLEEVIGVYQEIWHESD